MKFAFILIALTIRPVLAATPLKNKDYFPEYLKDFEGFQPIQFRVFDSTPSWDELQEGQIVVVSTGEFVTLNLRIGTTNYQVRFSSIQGK